MIRPYRWARIPGTTSWGQPGQPEHVGVELAAHLGRRDLLDRARQLESCAVDQDVDLAAAGRDRLHGSDHRRVVGDVQRQHAYPRLSQPRQGARPAGRGVHHQAGLVQPQRGLPPDARRTASHQRGARALTRHVRALLFVGLMAQLEIQRSPRPGNPQHAVGRVRAWPPRC